MDIMEYFAVKNESLCGWLWRISWLWLGHVTGHYTDTLGNQEVLVKWKWNSFGIATFGGLFFYTNFTQWSWKSSGKEITGYKFHAKC